MTGLQRFYYRVGLWCLERSGMANQEMLDTQGRLVLARRLSEYVIAGNALHAQRTTDYRVPTWLTDVGGFLEVRCERQDAKAFQSASTLGAKLDTLRSVRDRYRS